MSTDSLLVKIADPPGLRGRIFQDAVSASGVALTQYEDSLETSRPTDLWRFIGDRVRPLEPKMSWIISGVPQAFAGGNRALI